METYYTLVIFIAIATSLIMCAAVHSNAMLPTHEKRLFFLLFGTIVTASLCEWGGVMLSGHGADVKTAITVLKALEFSLAPTLALLFAAVMNPHDRPVKIALYVALAHAVLECALAPFGIVFFVDGQGVYHHGEAYPIYIAAYLASAAFLMHATKRFTETFQYRNRNTPWLILAFVFAAVLTQLIWSDLRIVWLALAIGGIMFYIFYCSVIQQTDALTRLLNRHSFESTASMLKAPATLILFDVDDFKTINDTYGHAAGDECLQLIGEAIYDTFGAHGSCFRVGGDEFCALMTDSRADMADLERSFLATLGHMRAEHPTLPRVSLGEAAFDPAQDDVTNAYQHADATMYANKKSRKQADGQ